MNRIGVNFGRRGAGSGIALGVKNEKFACMWLVSRSQKQGSGNPYPLTLLVLLRLFLRRTAIGLGAPPSRNHLFWPTLEPPGEVTFFGKGSILHNSNTYQRPLSPGG